MAKVSPKNNLDPNSAPWGRYVNSMLDELNAKVTRTVQGVSNANQQLNAQVNYIARQLSMGVDTTTGYFSIGITSVGARSNVLTNDPRPLYIDADGNIGVIA